MLNLLMELIKIKRKKANGAIHRTPSQSIVKFIFIFHLTKPLEIETYKNIVGYWVSLLLLLSAKTN
jgi:hypothetical protein